MGWFFVDFKLIKNGDLFKSPFLFYINFIDDKNI